MKPIARILIPAILFASCGGNNNDAPRANTFSVQEMQSPAADSSGLPFLTTDPSGTVYLSWTQKRNGIATLQYAVLSGGAWRSTKTISSGNNWFVNWADYPVIASDGKGTLMAHFLQKSDTAKFAYDVKLVHSNDSGMTWSAPATLHDDGQKAEHGFVSLIPYREGFFASWLDGRNTATAAPTDHKGHEGHHGQMTLRAALLDNNGVKQQEWELDDRVCDCCQTAAAVTDSGLVVVYRDRSAAEVRDMSIVRFVNGQWTEPMTIHADGWTIAGCPVNGPRVAATGNRLAIAWYSMPDKAGHVQVTFSTDGGAHFGEPIRIDEGKAIGRVGILWLDEQAVLVSWMEGSTIKAAKVFANGTREASFVVAASSEARSGGFPQMAKQGSRVLFAWTDDKSRSVKAAHVTF